MKTSLFEVINSLSKELKEDLFVSQGTETDKEDIKSDNSKALLNIASANDPSVTKLVMSFVKKQNEKKKIQLNSFFVSVSQKIEAANLLTFVIEEEFFNMIFNELDSNSAKAPQNGSDFVTNIVKSPDFASYVKELNDIDLYRRFKLKGIIVSGNKYELDQNAGINYDAYARSGDPLYKFVYYVYAKLTKKQAQSQSTQQA